MIEKFSEQDLKTIINELRKAGYEVRQTSKQMVMKEEAVKMFGGDPFVCADIGGSIFKIADIVTSNYEWKSGRKTARKHIPNEIEETYRTIISGMLGVIKQYYGLIGFRDRNAPVDRDG